MNALIYALFFAYHPAFIFAGMLPYHRQFGKRKAFPSLVFHAILNETDGKIAGLPHHRERNGETMLQEQAEKYYLDGYNCAECMVHAANDVYALGLDEHAMRLAAGFGGGMQVGDVCGALCGALCAIASRYVKNKAHDTPALAPLNKEVIARFQEQFGSLRCADIKPRCFHPQNRCLQTVQLSAAILEDVLAKWDAQNELM